MKSLGRDLKEILKGSAQAFVIRILGISIMYIVTLYVTNTFGASVYGDFVLFLTTAKILTILCVFGTDMMLLKKISELLARQNWNLQIQEYMTLSYLSVILIGLVMAVLLFLFKSFLFQHIGFSYTTTFFLAGILIPLAFNRIHSQCYRGLKNIRIFAVLEFVLIFLVYGIIIFSLHYVFEFEHEDLLIISYSLAAISVGIFGFIIWSIKRKSFGVLPSRSNWISRNFKFLRASSPFLLATSFVLVATWIIHFALKFFGDSSQLGIYDAAFKVSLFIAIPLMAVNSIAAPKIAETFAKDDFKGLAKVAYQSTTLSILCAYPIGVLLLFFPHLVIPLFGEEFVEGATALQIVVVAQMINATSGPVGLMLQMTGSEHTFKNIAFTCTFACASVSIILIPTYGISGAAIAYLAFVMLGSFMGLYFVHKKLSIFAIPLISDISKKK